jgi:hypothetical protein
MNSRWSFALALCLSVLVFSHADADHHKKKNQDNDAQLEQCTIVGPHDDFSCSGLKRVCQKLKSGKKCCGCVGDKSAQSPESNPPPSPQEDQAGTPPATLLLPGEK